MRKLFVSIILTVALTGITAYAESHQTENNNVADLVKKIFTYSNPSTFSYTYFNGTRDQTVREVRDPVIIREGDVYYLIYTHYPFTHSTSRDPSKPDYNSSPGIKLYKSNDLENWEFVNWLVKSSELSEKAAYKHRFWAPEIHKINGRFFLIFTADNWISDENNLGGKIGNYEAFIGVADQITGPYKNISWLQGGACDTSLFQDDDGKTYAIMPLGGDQYIQEIDLKDIDKRQIFLRGTRQKVVSHDYSSIGKESPHYLEGPWLIKRNGKYYLFSAANYQQPANPTPGFEYGYWVDAAVADNIWGPYEIHPQIFLGGHIGTFIGPDGKEWFSYRGEWRSNPGFGELHIDPVPLNEDGAVFKTYPTTGKQTIEYWGEEGTGMKPIDSRSDLIFKYHNNSFTITSLKDVIQSVAVFNLQGQIMCSATNISQTTFTIPASLASGLYMVKVQRDNRVDIIKFMNV